MRAVQITRFGGPEVLDVVDLPDPVPGPGQELFDVSTAGVNYADTHQIEDSYLAAQQLPLVPGAEFVGTSAGGGPRVVGLLEGGGYAEKVAASPRLTWPVPDGVTDEQALAVVLQGSTAYHLLRTSAHLAAGETVVVIAGAGGVGSLAVQLAKKWGAGRVIATASSSEKQSLARELGADVVVDSTREDMKAALEEANDGRKVDVVLEMVGGATFEQSLRALAPFGRLVHFGQAGREGAPQLDPGALMARSQGVIGFWLVHMMRRPDLMTEAMDGMFELVRAGELEVVAGGEYPLADARRAHEDLRARTTVGKLVLRP